MGYLLNGVESYTLPIGLVQALMNAKPFRAFIETGTAGGESVEAASMLFVECHTIEIIPMGRLPIPGVTFHTGDSPKVLAQIIQSYTAEDYVLCWLDAHYSGDKPTEGNTVECPVLDEIYALTPLKKAVIIIDDARLFMGVPPSPLDARKWPMISQIFERCRASFPYHYITVTDDYVLCVPDEFRPSLDQEWRNRFHVRYPSASDKIRLEAKHVYHYAKDWFDNFVKGLE